MSETTSNNYLVVFQPSGKRGPIAAGINLKAASNILGVDIEGACGELGTCGKCKVLIGEGNYEKYGIVSSRSSLSPVSGSEKEYFSAAELEQGYRLGCQAQVQGDVVVFVPEESRLNKQIVRKEARPIPFELNPAVKRYQVELPPASLASHAADWQILQNELAKLYQLPNLSIDYQLLLRLQNTLREYDWKVAVDVWQDREVINVSSSRKSHPYGLAVDIGTTTVAGYLCDLCSGELAATVSMMNPQVLYGEDVMSRIGFTMTNLNGLATLNGAIIDGLNQLIGDACSTAGIVREDILDMTVVGNTCMHHLFLNLDPRYIGKAPFTPAYNHSIDVKARDLGYEAGAANSPFGLHIAVGAYVHVLPIEAGFVGADNVAVLITEKPYEQDQIELVIDIGTNGELIMGNRNHLVSCSCATGPAFEGAEIRNGMRAAPGAIEKIKIDEFTHEVKYKVIGNESWSDENKHLAARGLCGSAIIDVVPQLFLAGIIDKSGLFKSDLNLPRYRIVEGEGEYVIAWENETAVSKDIVVCQKDVRAIQLAKGAMYAGIKIMMEKLAVNRIDRIILAGAFGSFIDKESAAWLGLFPDIDIENVYAVGNAAGDGARWALLDVRKRKEADIWARRVEYLELTRFPNFDRIFMKAMWLPHMSDQFPGLEKLRPGRQALGLA